MPAPDDVYIGFSTTRLWLSRAIRWLTRSKFSHCWIRHHSSVWGGTWVTHADWPVVRQWPWETASAAWTVEQLYRPRFDIRPALQAVRCDFEQPYDLIGLFGMAYVMFMLRWFGRGVKNPIANHRRMFCSEFVAHIFKVAQLPDTGSWEPCQLTPQALEAYCAGHPELFDKIDDD